MPARSKCLISAASRRDSFRRGRCIRSWDTPGPYWTSAISRFATLGSWRYGRATSSASSLRGWNRSEFAFFHPPGPPLAAHHGRADLSWEQRRPDRWPIARFAYGGSRGQVPRAGTVGVSGCAGIHRILCSASNEERIIGHRPSRAAVRIDHSFPCSSRGVAWPQIEFPGPRAARGHLMVVERASTAPSTACSRAGATPSGLKSWSHSSVHPVGVATICIEALCWVNAKGLLVMA